MCGWAVGWFQSAPACCLPPNRSLPPPPTHPQAGMPERSKLLAAEWAELSEEAKQPFQKQAQVGCVLVGWLGVWEGS